MSPHSKAALDVGRAIDLNVLPYLQNTLILNQGKSDRRADRRKKDQSQTREDLHFRHDFHESSPFYQGD